MKKVFLCALFASCLVATQALAAEGKTYRTGDKYVEIKTTVLDVSKTDGLRDGEGIVDVQVKYKKPHEKNLTLNVVCPDNNYDQFADICSQTYYAEPDSLRLHYLLNSRSTKPRSMTFQFSVGEHVYSQEVVVPGKKLPAIKVTAPKGKAYREGAYVPVEWKPYRGDFNLYSIYLANKLVPGFAVNGEALEGELTSFSYQLSAGEFTGSNLADLFMANAASGNFSESKLMKNFYLIVEAHDAGGATVAEGKSSTFKIKE